MSVPVPWGLMNISEKQKALEPSTVNFGSTCTALTLGLAPTGRFISQYRLARSLPIFSMKSTCSTVHLSSCVLRTQMTGPSSEFRFQLNFSTFQ